MSLRGKLTEEAAAVRLFDEVNELDKELERTEIRKEQLLRKKELALRKEKHLDEDDFYEIKPVMANDIKAVIDKIDHYQNRKQFLDESINNMTEFFIHPENMMSLAGRMWPHFTNEMKDQIKFLYPDAHYGLEYGSIPRNKLATMCNNLKDVKDGLSKKEFSVIPKKIVEGDAWSLMNQSYNRFFPLKILVTALASMINTKKEQGENEYRWIDYEEFSKAAYDIALELSNKLKRIKDPVTGKNPRREVRISTGLPILHMIGEHDILDQKEKQKVFQDKVDKDEKSKERFLVCFVGPKSSSFMRIIDKAVCKICKKKFDEHYESSHDFSGHSKFGGALNETGLVYVRKNMHRRLEITLSKIGYDFFNFDNPFLDKIEVKALATGETEFHKNDDGLIDKKVFSNDEMNFIMKEIIPRFDLEGKIIDSVIKWMKNKSEVDGIQLDTPIEKTVSDWVKKNKSEAEEEGIGTNPSELIGSYRHATMSRLAEIGKLTWIMKPKKNKDGTKGFPESFYEINK